MGSIAESRWSKKESMNLKADLHKLANLKNKRVWQGWGERIEPLGPVGQYKKL